jgi:hypothetical protein
LNGASFKARFFQRKVSDAVILAHTLSACSRRAREVKNVENQAVMGVGLSME